MDDRERLNVKGSWGPVAILNWGGNHGGDALLPMKHCQRPTKKKWAKGLTYYVSTSTFVQLWKSCCYLRLLEAIK